MSPNKRLTQGHGFLKNSLAEGAGVSGSLVSNNVIARSNTFLEIDPKTNRSIAQLVSTEASQSL